MPDFPTRRAQRRREQQHTIASSGTSTGELAPRSARRKQETRARLLEAALRLTAEKGMESVAINDITEAADVGFGSFYNHFESKEVMFSALMESMFEEFATRLDRMAGNLSDPAEVVAVSVRQTLMRARRERVWGQLLIREGLSPRFLNHGLGQRLLRDSRHGVACGRFIVPDPFMCLMSVSGTVLAAIAAELLNPSPGAPGGRAEEHAARGRDTLAERAAAMVLQALGLTCDEAQRVARQPLPAAATRGT